MAVVEQDHEYRGVVWLGGAALFVIGAAACYVGATAHWTRAGGDGSFLGVRASSGWRSPWSFTPVPLWMLALDGGRRAAVVAAALAHVVHAAPATSANLLDEGSGRRGE